MAPRGLMSPQQILRLPLAPPFAVVLLSLAPRGLMPPRILRLSGIASPAGAPAGPTTKRPRWRVG
eukprot:4718413-Pyramimonas_sp.AAC.1